MLSVNGYAVIDPSTEIKEIQYGPKNILFSCVLIGKHPYKEERVYYRASIIVAGKDLEKAREKLQPGRGFIIRLGELEGNKSEKGGIFNTIKTYFHSLEFFKKDNYLDTERKEEPNV